MAHDRLLRLRRFRIRNVGGGVEDFRTLGEFWKLRNTKILFKFQVHQIKFWRRLRSDPTGEDYSATKTVTV